MSAIWKPARPRGCSCCWRDFGRSMPAREPCSRLTTQRHVPARNRIEQDMTMALTADQAPTPHRAVRIALIVLSAILTFGALKTLPLAFHDYAPRTPLGVFAQRLTTVQILLTPLLTAAAL